MRTLSRSRLASEAAKRGTSRRGIVGVALPPHPARPRAASAAEAAFTSQNRRIGIATLAIALWHGMGLEAVAGLIVAVFELKAVQAVTKAINANLPKDGPLGTIRPSSAQLYARPRRFYSPTPERRMVPRPVSDALPLRTPARDVYDPTCRDVQCRQGGYSRPSGVWTIDDGSTPKRPGPVDPPWKHLPAVAGAAGVEIKIIRPKVDMIRKGTLFDFYA